MYAGTLADYDLLVDEGYLDPTDAFEVVTEFELRVRLLTRTGYDAFWRGYRTATADAAAAVKAIERPSLLRRVVGWLA